MALFGLVVLLVVLFVPDRTVVLSVSLSSFCCHFVFVRFGLTPTMCTTLYVHFVIVLYAFPSPSSSPQPPPLPLQ